MWSFFCKSPAVNLSNDGCESISLGSLQQDVFYQTTAKFTTPVARTVEAGRSSIEIYRGIDRRMLEILHMDGVKPPSEAFCGFIKYWPDSNSHKSLISCVAGLQDSQFEFVKQMSTLLLSSPKSLLLRLAVDFAGFASETTTEGFLTAREFENNKPHFFSELSITVYEQ